MKNNLKVISDSIALVQDVRRVHPVKDSKEQVIKLTMLESFAKELGEVTQEILQVKEVVASKTISVVAYLPDEIIVSHIASLLRNIRRIEACLKDINGSVVGNTELFIQIPTPSAVYDIKGYNKALVDTKEFYIKKIEFFENVLKTRTNLKEEFLSNNKKDYYDLF